MAQAGEARSSSGPPADLSTAAKPAPPRPAVTSLRHVAAAVAGDVEALLLVQVALNFAHCRRRFRGTVAGTGAHVARHRLLHGRR